ncbi:conserved exported protein of unknown function [Tenacibaculum sp. 190130A14a]|uniref:DUF4468 domain-containing protein n=1 Tax=Tenacibaculum polynesiense TaxID=3137857 RepID=A0ABM9PCD3_9FLAO
MRKNFKKATIFLMLLLTVTLYSQTDGYNEMYQLKKINNELEKHYDKSVFQTYYKLVSIKDDVLKIKKFFYTKKGLFNNGEFYLPMNSIDVSNIKYKKKSVLIRTKEKKRVIEKKDKGKTTKFFGLYLKSYAGKKMDKEIMEMLIELFKKH